MTKALQKIWISFCCKILYITYFLNVTATKLGISTWCEDIPSVPNINYFYTGFLFKSMLAHWAFGNRDGQYNKNNNTIPCYFFLYFFFLYILFLCYTVSMSPYSFVSKLPAKIWQAKKTEWDFYQLCKWLLKSKRRKLIILVKSKDF